MSNTPRLKTAYSEQCSQPMRIADRRQHLGVPRSGWISHCFSKRNKHNNTVRKTRNEAFLNSNFYWDWIKNTQEIRQWKSLKRTNLVMWNAAESTLGYLHRGTCTQEHSDYTITKLNLHSSEMGPVWHKAKVWRKRGFQSTGLFSLIYMLAWLPICQWMSTNSPPPVFRMSLGWVLNTLPTASRFVFIPDGLVPPWTLVCFKPLLSKQSGKCSFAYRGPTVTVGNKLLHIIRHAFTSTQKKQRNFSVRKICNLWFKEWE